MRADRPRLVLPSCSPQPPTRPWAGFVWYSGSRSVVPASGTSRLPPQTCRFRPGGAGPAPWGLWVTLMFGKRGSDTGQPGHVPPERPVAAGAAGALAVGGDRLLPASLASGVRRRNTDIIHVPASPGVDAEGDVAAAPSRGDGDTLLRPREPQPAAGSEGETRVPRGLPSARAAGPPAAPAPTFTAWHGRGGFGASSVSTQPGETAPRCLLNVAGI